MIKSAIGFALFFLLVSAASAQIQVGTVQNTSAGPLACSAYVAVPPTLRAEGITEQVGDVVLTCTGGITPAAGSALPTVNITVSLGTNVTSRLLGTNGVANASEALLIIDEPGAVPNTSTSLLATGMGGNAAQTLCNAPATIGAGAGGCTQYAQVVACTGPGCNALGTIAVMSSSNGASTAPANIYQGVVSGNQVIFNGIPVLQPAITGIGRVFRITNLRANIAGLSAGGSGFTPLTVAVSASALLPIQNPVLTAGFITSGLTTAINNSANTAVASASDLSKSQCSPSGNNNATAPQPLAVVQFKDNFGTAFKTRVVPTTSYGGQSSSPVQNVPGVVYSASESGFVATALTASGSTAGLADYGTRLKAVFNNVPPGVRLFVSTTNLAGNGASTQATTSAPAPNSTAAFAALVSSETASEATSVPLVSSTTNVNNGTTLLAEIPLVNNSGTAVWEVLNTNPAAFETLNFGVWEMYTTAPAGVGTVNLSYAPTPGTFTATTGPIPRFADTSIGTNIIQITACAPSITATATPTAETAFTNAPFPSPLQVTVKDSLANPVSGAQVSFVAPQGSGISLSSNSVTTNAQGIASVTATAGGTPGPYTVVANVGGQSPASVNFALTVQSIPSAPTSAAPTVDTGGLPTFTYIPGGSGTLTAALPLGSNIPTSFSVTSSANWLTAAPASGTTPATVSLKASPSSLTPGSYTAMLTFSFGDGTVITVPVHLQVQGPPQLTLSGPTVDSSAAYGSTATVSQLDNVGATGHNMNVQLAASGGAWLSVTPTSGTTPLAFQVQMNPTGLNPGTYTGAITITSPDAGSPVSIPVVFTITGTLPAPAPSISITSVQNAASFSACAAAPNTILSLFGTFPGCNSARATVDAAATDVLYSSATQINLLVPGRVAGESTASLQISCAGLTSAAMPLAVANAAPGIFAVINPDGSKATSVSAGSAIVAFVTGFGPLGARGDDGLAHLTLPVSAAIAGQPLQVLYAGEAPGFTTGLQQIDILIPPGTPAGANLQLQLSVAGVSATTPITIR